MDNKDNSLENGQPLGSVGIHQSAYDTNSNHEQRLVPVLLLVGGMVDRDHGKDDHCTAISGSGDECLPLFYRQYLRGGNEAPGYVRQVRQASRQCMTGNSIESEEQILRPSLMQMVLADRRKGILGRANSRYCPPEVGAIEAISANEAARVKVQSQDAK